MTDIEVGAPTFTVTTRPVSSYTYYEDNKINEANRSDGIGGSAIWIETKIGISENLINNSNYSLNLSGDFSTNTGKRGTITGSGINSNIHIHKDDNLKSLDWREHKVSISCSVTFDNKTVEAQKTEQACHVTGLPYTIRTDGATPSGWKTSNTEKIGVAGDYMCMKNGDAYAISPKFYSPESESINTKVTVNAYAYRGWASYSPKMYISASSTGTKTGDGVSVATSDAYPVTAAFGDYSADLVFNSTVSQTCVYTSGQKGAGVTGFTASVVVNEIHVKYR